MKKSYFDSGGNDTELIAVLNAISHVSARMARNMTILAQQRQSEKGERRYEQNERYGYDHRRATQCSRSINEAANWLAEQFSGTTDEEPATKPAAKEDKKPELKLEDVRAVLAEKSRAGHTAAIRTLLQKYGASKLSAVDPKHYEALLKDAEVLDDAT